MINYSRINTSEEQTYILFQSTDHAASIEICCEERNDTCTESFYSWLQELQGNRVILREPKGKKNLVVHTQSLKVLPIATAALEQLVYFTAGASNRYYMLKNLLFPHSPALKNSLYGYSGGAMTDEQSQIIFEKESKIAIQHIHSLLAESTSNFYKPPLLYPKDGVKRQLSEKYTKIINYASQKRHEIAFLQNSTLTEENNPFGIKRTHEYIPIFFGCLKKDRLQSLSTALKDRYEDYGCLLINLAKQRGYKCRIEHGEEVGIGRDVKSYGAAHLTVVSKLEDVHNDKQYLFEHLCNIHEVESQEGWVISIHLQSTEEKWDELVAEYFLPKISGNSSSMENLQFDIPIIFNYPLSDKVEDWIDKQMEACYSWRQHDGKEELKERVAILRYLLAVSSPYKRGSAAIAEFIEKAIYEYHGFGFEYKYPRFSIKKPAADLDAYVCFTLEEFILTYKSKAIVLEPV